MKAVKEFINEIKPFLNADIVGIDDVYGPTIHKAEFQCLVLSQETTKGGSLVNEQREINVSCILLFFYDIVGHPIFDFWFYSLSCTYYFICNNCPKVS